MLHRLLGVAGISLFLALIPVARCSGGTDFPSPSSPPPQVFAPASLAYRADISDFYQRRSGSSVEEICLRDAFIPIPPGNNVRMAARNF